MPVAPAAGIRLREVRIVELNRVGVPFGVSFQENLARKTIVCKGARGNNQIGEHARFEGGLGACSSLNFRQYLHKTLVDGGHLLHGGLVFRSDQGIPKFAKHTSRFSAVNIVVCSPQVTQGLVYPPALCLKHEPDVPAGVQFVPGYGKSEFERHIEAGRGGPPHIQLNPREVVKGISATFDKVKDAVQATGAAGNLDRCSRGEAKGGNPGNVRKIEILKCEVVRNVEEGARQVSNCRTRIYGLLIGHLVQNLSFAQNAVYIVLCSRYGQAPPVPSRVTWALPPPGPLLPPMECPS